MSFQPKDWVALPDGTVAQVVEVGRDGDHEAVLVETPGGSVHERPVAFAERNWRRLPADGLRVRVATAPELVRLQTREDPIGVVAAALLDAGGTATSDEIQEAVGLVVPEQELRAWWRRIQRRLEDDDRIDTAQALERRYRLIAPGERKLGRLRARRTGRSRDGRELLDWPTLLDARERMKDKGPRSDSDLGDLLAEAARADDPTVEPTGRFLAGEIAIVLGTSTEDELAARLGEDCFALDLLRMKEHDSRDRALRLALRRPDAPIDVVAPPPTEGPTLWSAIAAGPRWAEPVVQRMTEIGVPARPIVARALTWAIPGSPEAGDLNYPLDLEIYRKRVPVLGELVQSLRDAGNEVVAAACLQGLRWLEEVPQHGSEWTAVAGSLCAVMWDACATDPGAARAAVGKGSELGVDSWRVIAETVPPDLMGMLESVLRDAYAARPSLLPAFTELVARRGSDPVRAILDVARTVIAGTTARTIAVDAVHQSSGIRGAGRESATLAGTIWPEHPDVKARLEALQEAVRTEILTGIGEMGPVLLSGKAWSQVVGSTHAHIEHVEQAAATANQATTEATSRVADLEAALERRREAIQEVQQRRSDDQASSAQRIATSLYKPIAAALADSFEAGSLGALQDALFSALARARIEPIAEPGTVVPFDPDLHSWVGAGYPGAMVRVLTPGFITRREEADVMVLALARVDDPEAGG
jgi:hypothetical protein